MDDRDPKDSAPKRRLPGTNRNAKLAHRARDGELRVWPKKRERNEWRKSTSPRTRRI